MAENKINLKEVIPRTINFLSSYFDVQEVILFGSRVSGKGDEWSDIDLAIISPDFKNKSYEEIIQVFAELAVKTASFVELHAFTPEELKNARPTNFLGYLLQTGKVVYRNGNLLV